VGVNLSELIDAHRAGRSYDELSRACGGTPTSKRLQQLARQPIKNFPDPATVKHLAHGLKVSQTAVVLASAVSLGLDVGTPMPRLVELLPSDADQLSEEQAAAVAQLVRSIVRRPAIANIGGAIEVVASGSVGSRTQTDVIRPGFDIDIVQSLEPTVHEVLAARERLRAVAQKGEPSDAEVVDELARLVRERDSALSTE
jgi:hypothetical protein